MRLEGSGHVVAVCSARCQRAAWLELARVCATGGADYAQDCDEGIGGGGGGGGSTATIAGAAAPPARIGFCLYMCTVPLVGDLVARVWPAAMVHQRIVQDAVCRWEEGGAGAAADGTRRRRWLDEADCERLVAGVLWNDMPTPDDGDARYAVVRVRPARMRALYERHHAAFSCGCERCERCWRNIDARFCYGAPTSAVVTMCAALCVPPALAAQFAPSRCVLDAHRGDRAHIHAMVGSTAAEQALSVRQKRDRIVAQLCAWAKCAARTNDLFYIGHCLHTVQDAYAARHVERCRRTGDIVRFLDYRPEQAAAHSRADTMRAYAHSAMRERMLDACALFLEQRRHHDTSRLRRQLQRVHFRLAEDAADDAVAAAEASLA